MVVPSAVAGPPVSGFGTRSLGLRPLVGLAASRLRAHHAGRRYARSVARAGEWPGSPSGSLVWGGHVARGCPPQRPAGRRQDTQPVSDRTGFVPFVARRGAPRMADGAALGGSHTRAFGQRGP